VINRPAQTGSATSTPRTRSPQPRPPRGPAPLSHPLPPSLLLTSPLLPTLLFLPPLLPQHTAEHRLSPSVTDNRHRSPRTADRSFRGGHGQSLPETRHEPGARTADATQCDTVRHSATPCDSATTTVTPSDLAVFLNTAPGVTFTAVPERSHGSVEERSVHTGKVAGSIPAGTTEHRPGAPARSNSGLAHRGFVHLPGTRPLRRYCTPCHRRADRSGATQCSIRRSRPSGGPTADSAGSEPDSRRIVAGTPQSAPAG
jgi:hypothetical protein